MKPIEIEDDSGVPWLVYEEDPAGDLVKSLQKVVQYIVLPRNTIITGCIYTYEDIVDLDDVVAMPQSLVDIIIRKQRCYDCVRYLQDGGVMPGLV